ncbi:hypothetical protein VTN77DRAFT_7178 [Rasamsonia byssochlamydoides]|uniref:uncharacterized protein n=1 Tax=Rasamsonia byssochlamydoides TaxID=89139 RepID=UPI0037442616
MHSSYTTAFALLLSFFSPALSIGRPPGKDAILLSKVHSLTLHADRLTTGRRTDPIPQLTCTGPSKSICKLYPIETMRCTNQGYDYDEEDIQWTCTASLPPEFKLGATDVVCEGYRSPDDKWVLKGSCGVEYRLLLTEEGERRFGHLRDADRWRISIPDTGLWETLASLLFFALFFGCLAFILYRLYVEWFGSGRNRRRGDNGQGWGWGWGGGGGGGGGGDDPRGPPPPYDYNPGNRFFKSPTSGSSWTPGFWTGALTGAMAGYQMGRRGQERNTIRGWGPGPSSYRGSYEAYDPGEGSSTQPPRFSSSRPSTGFGSTRRR